MMRPLGQIESHFAQIRRQRIDIMEKWAKIMNAILLGDSIVHNRYHPKMRDSIERWLASASGTVRTMEWCLGRRTFWDSLETITPEQVDDLHLPAYDEKHARPLGPIEGIITDAVMNEMYPSHQARNEEHMRGLLRHSALVHREIYRIKKWHPGKWHPMFEQRVTNTLLFFDSVIRTFEWVLAQADNERAFYAFSDEVLLKLRGALDGIAPLDSGLLVTYAMPADDHEPEDFERADSA